MTNPAILEALAKAMNGPHLPVPGDSKHTLSELRDIKWQNIGKGDRQNFLNQAAAVLELVGPRELEWSGKEDDCYMQTTTSTSVYCIGVINDGWYAEFEAHSAPRPVSLGWHHNDAATAQAAAQAHADAAHWNNTKLGDMLCQK